MPEPYQNEPYAHREGVCGDHCVHCAIEDHLKSGCPGTPLWDDGDPRRMNPIPPHYECDECGAWLPLA